MNALLSAEKSGEPETVKLKKKTKKKKKKKKHEHKFNLKKAPEYFRIMMQKNS